MADSDSQLARFGYVPMMARRCRERFTATKRCVREDLHPGKHLVVTDGEPVKWKATP